MDNEDFDRAENHFCETLEATIAEQAEEIKSLRAQLAEREWQPTPEQVDSACMYYRHDFGLLSKKDKDALRFYVSEIGYAWEKVRQDTVAKGRNK